MSMSTLPFLFLIMMMSSILCFMMNSWIMIWIMLEMNTLSFCSLMKTFSSKKKEMSEYAMKYFIIQSISSAMLIFSSLSLKSFSSISMSLVFMSMMSLMIKIGASPFHQWFINIVKKIMWKSNTILMTWQKLAPVYLVIYQSMKSMVMPFIITSAILGAIMQMNKKKTLEIMGFSSVFNLSWMLLAIVLNTYLFLMFCVIYWFAVMIVMIMIKNSKLKNISDEKFLMMKKWLIMTVMINLGGIPPMAGFISKWIVFSEMLKFNMLTLVTLFLMVSSINLYVYLRLTNNHIMKNTLKSPKAPSMMKKYILMSIVMANSIPLMIMSF